MNITTKKISLLLSFILFLSCSAYRSDINLQEKISISLEKEITLLKIVDYDNIVIFFEDSILTEDDYENLFKTIDSYFTDIEIKTVAIQFTYSEGFINNSKEFFKPENNRSFSRIDGIFLED